MKNEGEAIVVGRIIRGGTAEASGLLHEGDEILEVNEVELRGKDVNEVCDLLANMQGTLTFLVVPTRRHLVSFKQETEFHTVESVKFFLHVATISFTLYLLFPLYLRSSKKTLPCLLLLELIEREK